MFYFNMHFRFYYMFLWKKVDARRKLNILCPPFVYLVFLHGGVSGSGFYDSYFQLDKKTCFSECESNCRKRNNISRPLRPLKTLKLNAV